jgi:hypothetical protein
MKVEDKIRVLAEQKAFGIRRLIKVGSSFAITVPKIWVNLHCLEVDDKYYLRLEAQDDLKCTRGGTLS